MSHTSRESQRGVAAATTATLRATCWGTRGSVPCPGEETVRFGGNTACIEVRTSAPERLIFDAGTGIRRLGQRLRSEPEPLRGHLFLTHFHWDHIQGLPFFGSLYDPRTQLTIHAPAQAGGSPEELLASQMGPAHFPITLHELPAQLRFATLQDSWTENGVEVTAMRTFHPSDTTGYRVRADGASVAYFPDNELGRQGNGEFERWYSDLLYFLRGVDCLIHDAMFTAQEYTNRVGWGHSTFEQAIELAEDAEVKRLLLFHHAPDRSDNELEEILASLRSDLERRGSPLLVDLATEGAEIVIG